MAFLVGYSSRAGKILALFLPRLPDAWNRTRSTSTAGLMTLFGAFSLWALITFHGGWTAFTADRATALTKPGQEYLRQGVGLIPLAFLLVLTFSMGLKRGRLVVVLVGGLTLAILGFVNGSKFEMLYPLLATVLVTHYLGSQQIGIRHLATLTMGAVLVFPILNHLRHNDSLATALTATRWTPTEVGEQLMARFYGIDALTLCVRDTPEVMDFQYGSTIAPILTAWIPRAIFPEKPVVTFGKVFGETYMKEHFAGTGTSASPTLLGDAYINFHLPGMLLVSFAYGAVLRTIYTWTIQSHFGAPAVFLYIGTLPLGISAWEGAIGASLVLAAVRIIVLLSVVWLAGEWRRPRAAQTSVKSRIGQSS